MLDIQIDCSECGVHISDREECYCYECYDKAVSYIEALTNHNRVQRDRIKQLEDLLKTAEVKF